MARLVTQESLAFAEEPLVLIGDPRGCRGVLRVHNPGDATVRIKRLHLRTAARELLRCEGEPIELQTRSALCAGESQLVPVTLRLPPGTPPGRYEASLEGGKPTVNVVIEVLERRRLRLAPARIERTCRRGETFTVKVSATNAGNVPIEIPGRVAAELHAVDHGFLHQFHATAKAHGGDGYEKFLNAFAKRLSDEEPPVGRARVVAGQGTLRPQSARVVELELGLPKKLKAGRRYRAVVNLAGARLSMNLHVSGEGEREVEDAAG